uniref:Uncharacterized protein n=1 Tax=Macrostomum lignano TaxID=282301 RepID=A0A1I8JPA2_9PLAT
MAVLSVPARHSPALLPYLVVSGLHRLPSNGPSGPANRIPRRIPAGRVLPGGPPGARDGPAAIHSCRQFPVEVPGFALLLRVDERHAWHRGDLRRCAAPGPRRHHHAGGLRRGAVRRPFYSIEWVPADRLRAVAISAGRSVTANLPGIHHQHSRGHLLLPPGLGLLAPAVRADPPAAGDHAGLFPRQAAYLHRRPLLPGPGETPTKLARRTQERMRRLIDSKQRLPGSVICGS